MTTVDPSSRTMDTGEIQVLLQRIARATEQKQRGRLELLIAILLSLATLGSTWCGYESGQWGGAASSAQTSADTAERHAAENAIIGLQMRTQDGLVLLEYWRAIRAGDTSTQGNIEAHMRPVLRTAIKAAVDSGVLNDPSLAGPLQRPEYALPEEAAAAEQRTNAGELRAAATESARIASSYVVLTLMFASVLFFGGIAGTFMERRVRMGLAFMAIALFAVTAVMLLGLPTYHDAEKADAAASAPEKGRD